MSMTVAARTLGMQSVLENLKRDFPVMSASVDDPLLAYYLLAARTRFPEVAKRLVSDLHHDVFSYGYVPEMEHTPAHFYHSLLVNRRKNAPIGRANGAASKAKSSASSSASGAKKPKMGGVRDSTGEVHPWVKRLVADFTEKLYSLDRSMDLYDVSPRYLEILQDSVREKAWCRDCESGVRSIVGMEVSWKRVRDALSDNDVGCSSTATRCLVFY